MSTMARILDNTDVPTDSTWPALPKLPKQTQAPHEKPRKRINDGTDVSFFLSSISFTRLLDFLQQLNLAMRPVLTSPSSITSLTHAPLASPPSDEFPLSVRRIGDVIRTLKSMISDIPPNPGPHRFGNVSFRKWSEAANTRIPALVQPLIPSSTATVGTEGSEDANGSEELATYLSGSFGNAQRLDYGTGHELSFLAFLAGIWMMHGFDDCEDTRETSRAIVLGVLDPYFDLIRTLIITYTLEPAGSHGVWGLDDHSFLPYILGSAQYCPQLDPSHPRPLDVGSLPDAPATTEVVKRSTVNKLRGQNMYFDAIAFIYDVKTGPFWEHSPILYDISGVKDGWAKINKGMMKMYVAEVLSKFPVVQHFPFGSLFPWELDPNAPIIAQSVHTSSLPQGQEPPRNNQSYSTAPVSGMRAPWATEIQHRAPSHILPASPTKAPWAS